LYIGTERGVYLAINASSGTTIWNRTLGAYYDASCADLPGGYFGISGTGYINRTEGTLFVVSGLGYLHKLYVTTGLTVSKKWPVYLFDPSLEHSYGAVSAVGSSICVTTAGHCDNGNYNGKIYCVDPRRVTLLYTFSPSSPNYGGGIWGSGGLSYDPILSRVAVAIGNSLGAEQSYYGDSIVFLSPQLKVLNSYQPQIIVSDSDFGATPLIFTPTNGCKRTLTSTSNKSGFIVIIDLATGEVLQTIQVGFPTSDGER